LITHGGEPKNLFSPQAVATVQMIIPPQLNYYCSHAGKFKPVNFIGHYDQLIELLAILPMCDRSLLLPYFSDHFSQLIFADDKKVTKEHMKRFVKVLSFFHHNDWLGFFVNNTSLLKTINGSQRMADGPEKFAQAAAKWFSASKNLSADVLQLTACYGAWCRWDRKFSTINFSDVDSLVVAVHAHASSGFFGSVRTRSVLSDLDVTFQQKISSEKQQANDPFSMRDALNLIKEAIAAMRADYAGLSSQSDKTKIEKGETLPLLLLFEYLGEKAIADELGNIVAYDVGDCAPSAPPGSFVSSSFSPARVQEVNVDLVPITAAYVSNAPGTVMYATAVLVEENTNSSSSVVHGDNFVNASALPANLSGG
jgi:hypothetical protein